MIDIIYSDNVESAIKHHNRFVKIIELATFVIDNSRTYKDISKFIQVVDSVHPFPDNSYFIIATVKVGVISHTLLFYNMTEDEILAKVKLIPKKVKGKTADKVLAQMICSRFGYLVKRNLSSNVFINLSCSRDAQYFMKYDRENTRYQDKIKYELRDLQKVFNRPDVTPEILDMAYDLIQVTDVMKS